MKPELEELVLKLEEKFGKLVPQAEHCAIDFHNRYEDFIQSIRSNEIIIVASPNMLADKLRDSKYSRYRTFSGLSILSLVIALIFLFFNWKIGLGFFVAAFISKKISMNLKYKASKNFANEITSKFSIDPDDGMFDLCQYYIAGILQLVSPKGKAHLPLIPSYSLTGIEKYARRKSKTSHTNA